MRRRREGGRVGNRRLPPRGRAGGPRRDPPLPTPPTGRKPRRRRPPTPRGRWDGPPFHWRDRGPREGGRSKARPPAPAACSHRNRGKQARRAPHGPRPETASEHEPERYGGHALHDWNDASDTRFVACPEKAEGRNEAEQPPTPLAPPAAQTGGTAHRPPPPPTPPPGAGTPRTRRPAPRGAHNPKPGRGGNGTGPPPPKHAKRSKGPGQDTLRGTDRVERPYQRPAPGPREVRAPHQPGEGGGRGRRGSASTHTHKGHAGNTRRATGPSLRNAQTAWNGIPASEGTGHPVRTAHHTQRGTRGAGRGKRGRHDTRYGPKPPEPAASAVHTRPGHCTRQRSSGALRHAPTPRLGSHRVSPRGSHWRQASSTDPAAPAPRATTH